ncbi:unnamed protein product [Arabidopsis arenosa]|uniref:Bifunctional inhibitor/plant lipid transfer protein/seed storage helical domain-containing protein n=1 Tax=Arabidopsis arenosa TaxID=38785 RepID=A0A8S2AM68_ARAAE|nr:unnamed protein product [Arabidopsis arenosa]
MASKNSASPELTADDPSLTRLGDLIWFRLARFTFIYVSGLLLEEPWCVWLAPCSAVRDPATNIYNQSRRNPRVMPEITADLVCLSVSATEVSYTFNLLRRVRSFPMLSVWISKLATEVTVGQMASELPYSDPLVSSLRRLLPTRILHSFHRLTSSPMRSISITRSPKQRSLYSRSAPTARNEFSSVFFASPVNRRRCFVSMSPPRVRDETLIVVGQSHSCPVLENRENIWDQIIRRKIKLIHNAGNHSLLWSLVSGFNMSIYKIGSMYQGDKGMTGMFTMDLLFSDSILSSPEERHGFNFLFVERETFSASIPHWRSKFLMCLLLMRSLVELRRSLPPCTTAKLSSASSSGSAASPKYRFSSFKSVAAICIIPPDLVPPILQVVRRVPSQPRVHLDPTIRKAPTTLFFGIDQLPVIKRPCSKIWMLLSCEFENPVSKNRDNKRDRILWCETNHILHLGNHSLLRPVAFGCNKSIFKFGKMNQGGQGMIGLWTLDLSFPDSINSSLEERHGFNFLFVERETSSASISHRRGKLLMCLLLRSLVESQNTMLSMVIPFTRRGALRIYENPSFVVELPISSISISFAVTLQSSPNPTPVTPPRTPGSSGNCPIDALRLGVCANVLSGLLNVQLGQPSAQPCCSLIQGLVDLDAAICLCTALRANVLGINLNVPISLSVLLNVCNRRLPSGFQCA